MSDERQQPIEISGGQERLRNHRDQIVRANLQAQKRIFTAVYTGVDAPTPSEEERDRVAISSTGDMVRFAALHLLQTVHPNEEVRAKPFDNFTDYVARKYDLSLALKYQQTRGTQFPDGVERTAFTRGEFIPHNADYEWLRQLWFGPLAPGPVFFRAYLNGFRSGELREEDAAIREVERIMKIDSDRLDESYAQALIANIDAWLQTGTKQSESARRTASRPQSLNINFADAVDSMKEQILGEYGPYYAERGITAETVEKLTPDVLRHLVAFSLFEQLDAWIVRPIADEALSLNEATHGNQKSGHRANKSAAAVHQLTTSLPKVTFSHARKRSMEAYLTQEKSLYTGMPLGDLPSLLPEMDILGVNTQSVRATSTALAHEIQAIAATIAA